MGKRNKVFSARNFRPDCVHIHWLILRKQSRSAQALRPNRRAQTNTTGDPEREAEAIRSKEGIPLIKPVVDDLLDISRKTGISFEIKC